MVRRLLAVDARAEWGQVPRRAEAGGTSSIRDYCLGADMMTVNEFWARLGINAVILVVGVVMLAGEIGLGGLLLVVGVLGIIWTAIRAKRQTMKMDRAIAEKRRRS